jgi:hypothetical protein
VFPSRTIATGASMSGHLILENGTGQSVQTAGCGSFFQVALTSKTYHPTIPWLTCLQSFTIPAGQSRYRVTIEANRSVCPQDSARDVMRCPLPPGDYHAVMFQLGHLVQAPRPVLIRVTR